jgi:hypothetical protein
LGANRKHAIGDARMNDIFEKRFVTIILRIIGILTVLVGLILTTHTIIQLLAISSLATNLPRGMNVNIKGTLGNMHGWAVLAHLFIIAWGVVFYKLADWLSGIIMGENQHEGSSGNQITTNT